MTVPLPHRSSPLAWRLPGATLLLSALAVLVFAAPGAAARLQYDRLAIGAGEVWRLVSGHWTHVGLDHLAWDLLAFAALGTLCETVSRRRFHACLLGATLLISAAVWLCLPGLTLYRGLSGIDSALYVLLAVTLLRDRVRARDRLGSGLAAAMLGGFAAKTAYEMLVGSTLFVHGGPSGMIAVPIAHAAGAVAGLLAALIPRRAADAACGSRSGPTSPTRTTCDEARTSGPSGPCR